MNNLINDYLYIYIFINVNTQTNNTLYKRNKT